MSRKVDVTWTLPRGTGSIKIKFQSLIIFRKSLWKTKALKLIRDPSQGLGVGHVHFTRHISTTPTPKVSLTTIELALLLQNTHSINNISYWIKTFQLIISFYLWIKTECNLILDMLKKIPNLSDCCHTNKVLWKREISHNWKPWVFNFEHTRGASLYII